MTGAGRPANNDLQRAMIRAAAEYLLFGGLTALDLRALIINPDSVTAFGATLRPLGGCGADWRIPTPGGYFRFMLDSMSCSTFAR